MTASAGKPAVVTQTKVIRIEAPELILCERGKQDEADLRLNGDLWELKDQAIKLLDTCETAERAYQAQSEQVGHDTFRESAKCVATLD